VGAVAANRWLPTGKLARHVQPQLLLDLFDDCDHEANEK
jgi:hypothetical protein